MCGSCKPSSARNSGVPPMGSVALADAATGRLFDGSRRMRGGGGGVARSWKNHNVWTPAHANTTNQAAVSVHGNSASVLIKVPT